MFYWDFKGASAGPGGTGNKVDIDGCEVWKLDNDSKIIEIKGTFDAEDIEQRVNGE